MSIQSLPHDYFEYGKVGFMASGGAAIALQTVIKKSSPDKILKTVNQLARFIGQSPLLQIYTNLLKKYFVHFLRNKQERQSSSVTGGSHTLFQR